MAERFLYLPSIGFAGCIVWGVCALWPRTARLRWIAFAVIAMAFSVRTYLRNFDWHDDLSLWSSAAQTAPNSYKARVHLAPALIGPTGAGLDQGLAQIERALEILRGVPDELSLAQPYAAGGFVARAIGDRWAGQGDRVRSREWHEKSLGILLAGRRIDVVAEERRRLLNARQGKTVKRSGWDPLYLELGDTWMRLGEPAKAIEAYEYGKSIQPREAFDEALAAARRQLGR